MSLAGYVAGPNQNEENPLGEGGEQLHEWAFPLAAWRNPHGEEGGEVNASSEVVENLWPTSGPTSRAATCSVAEAVPGAKSRGRDNVTGGPAAVGLECTRVVEAPGVTHLRYRVSRSDNSDRGTSDSGELWMLR